MELEKTRPQSSNAVENSEWQTDLKAIEKQVFSQIEKNEEFIRFLKNQDSQKIDAMVFQIQETVSKGIDCMQCANCCRSLAIAPQYPDIAKLSEQHNLTIQEFKDKYLKRDHEGDLVFKQRPCPFLKNNKCSTYESRPSLCQKYPYLDQKTFISRLANIKANLHVCPIVFNTFEMLKLQFS